MSHERRVALRAGLTTFAFSAAWIVGSDSLVDSALSIEYRAAAQSVKGLIYVAVAALLVYSLAFHDQRQAAAMKVQEAAMAEVQRMRTRALVTFGAWHDVRNIAAAFSLNAQVLPCYRASRRSWARNSASFRDSWRC